MRLGVFLPNWIGDVVMATPALSALRILAGDGALVGVMRPYVAEVLAGSSWFDETLIYSKKPARRERTRRSSDLAPQADRRSPDSTISHLRSLRLDAMVLFTNSLSTAWMAYRSGARQRIGTAGNLRSPLLTTRVHAPRQGWRSRRLVLPAVTSYLQVAQAAGAPPTPAILQLATTATDEQRADRIWRQLGWPRDARVAVLNTGGAFGAAKDWPREHFAELARRLVSERGWRVLVNCGPQERDSARSIVAAVGDARVASLADETELPIGLTKAVIRRSQLLVTTDSGPRFFGVAFGVPTVTLFGPTSTEFTRTFSAWETSVALGLDCQPCMARTCPLGHHRCMRELTIERVLTAVDEACEAAVAAAA
jgi:heptosyltransferase-2